MLTAQISSMQISINLYSFLFNFSKAAQLDSKIEDEVQWVCMCLEEAGGVGRKEDKREAKSLPDLGLGKVSLDRTKQNKTKSTNRKTD